MKDLASRPENAPFFDTYPNLESLKKSCEDELKSYGVKIEKLQFSELINDDFLIELDQIDLVVRSIHQRLEVIELIHPKPAWRDYASSFISKVTCEPGYFFSFKTLENKRIYTKLIDSINEDELQFKESKYLYTTLISRFKLTGLNLSADKSKELQDLRIKNKELESQFSKNIADNIPTLSFKEEELKGCPQDIIDSNRQKNGAIKIKLISNNRVAIATQCSVKETRERVSKASGEYAKPLNKDIMIGFLQNAQKIAEVCGFKNFAEIAMVPQMAKDPDASAKFIAELGSATKKRVAVELSAIERMKISMGDKSSMTPADRAYYSERVLEKVTNLKDSEVRPYFPYKHVKSEILKIFEEMFNIIFKQVQKVNPWHKDIETYLVIKNKKVIGRIHLDMHPRKGKYTHACEDDIRRGVKDKFLPEAILVCNFNKPGKNSDGLQSMGEVETFFHEFGHLLHEVFGSQNNIYSCMGGASTQWDFVEAPSQLLEQILVDPAVIKRLSSHHKTGKKLSDSLITKIINQDRPFRAIGVASQALFSMISLRLFTISDISIEKVEEMERELTLEYLNYERTYYTSYSFHHAIGGYTSNYYTYMWSLAIAKDLFTKFNKNNLLDTKAAEHYRKTILEPGGSKPASELVKDFLGRDWNMDAFREYLKEGEELLTRT